MSNLTGGGKAGVAGQLLLREIAEPTPAINETRQKALQAHLNYARSLIAEIVGTDDANAPIVHQCLGSLVSQVFMLCTHVAPPSGATAGKDSAGLGCSFLTTRHTSNGDLEAIAQHITAFSLGGMRAMRAQAQQQQHSGPQLAVKMDVKMAAKGAAS